MPGGKDFFVNLSDSFCCMQITPNFGSSQCPAYMSSWFVRWQGCSSGTAHIGCWTEFVHVSEATAVALRSLPWLPTVSGPQLSQLGLLPVISVFLYVSLSLFPLRLQGSQGTTADGWKPPEVLAWSQHSATPTSWHCGAGRSQSLAKFKAGEQGPAFWQEDLQ